MAGQMHRFDIGSVIRVKVTENGLTFDGSGAVVKTMKLKKPSGAVSEKPAEFHTNGRDGIFAIHHRGRRPERKRAVDRTGLSGIRAVREVAHRAFQFSRG